MKKLSRIAEIEPVDQDAAVDVVTVQQRVYSELRTDILLGRIAPGEPLTIRGLAERLGVSAMPIREAASCRGTRRRTAWQPAHSHSGHVARAIR